MTNLNLRIRQTKSKAKRAGSNSIVARTGQLVTSLGVVLALSVGTAFAEPIGITYLVDLEHNLRITPSRIIFEEKDGFVTFDNQGELVTGFASSITDPELVETPNDLFVTESIVSNSDGTEDIAIWVQGRRPGQTSVAPLFSNTFTNEFNSFIFAVFDLHWQNPNLEVEVSNIEVAIGFDGQLNPPLDPGMFAGSFGNGTPADPLGIQVFPDPSNLVGNPTDLRLSFTATPRLVADFDDDSDVDGSDFLEWQRSNGTSESLAAWRATYGADVGAFQATMAVPEPNGVCLVTIVCMLSGGVRLEKEW